jgi:hypothetical protein
VKVFLNRLGLLIYWAGFLFSIIMLLFSIDMLFSGVENSWLGLLFAVIVYFIGFAIRFLLSGKTNHFIFSYIKGLIYKR